MESFVTKPGLATWGIEEVEPNVCEDTFENRQRLIHAKVPFKILAPGLIETDFQDYDELNGHHRSMYERRSPVLSDKDDAWSDFIPFLDYPFDFMETAPAWIQRHKNKYLDAVASGTPEHKLPLLPNRCKRLRADNSRCWQWEWPVAQAEGFCRNHSSYASFHAGEQMAKMTDASRMRLSQLQGPALEALEDLILNSTVPHVRLKAATEVLDRTGIRAGSDITISGTVTHEAIDPAQAVRDRLNSLAERLSPPPLELEESDVIEGEVVLQHPAPETVQVKE